MCHVSIQHLTLLFMFMLWVTNDSCGKHNRDWKWNWNCLEGSTYTYYPVDTFMSLILEKRMYTTGQKFRVVAFFVFFFLCVSFDLDNSTELDSFYSLGPLVIFNSFLLFHNGRGYYWKVRLKWSTEGQIYSCKYSYNYASLSPSRHQLELNKDRLIFLTI